MIELFPIIDTHQHLIDTDHSAYAWTNTIRQLNGRQFGYRDYLAASKKTGIVQTVFVETNPDRWLEEVSWVYSLADQPQTLIKGIVANCRPEDAGFDAYVDSIRHRSLVGLRRVCHTEPDDLSQQSRFIENVNKLNRYGLTFDLCFLARQLPLAIKLVRSCPEVQFILDHCGVPDIASGEIQNWRASLQQISELPNVVCKLSGLLAYCSPFNTTLHAIRPYVMHAIDCFGASRLVWGSDWPVVNTQSTLSKWVQITRQLLADLTPVEQRNILYENAQNVYGLTRSM